MRDEQGSEDEQRDEHDAGTERSERGGERTRDERAQHTAGRTQLREALRIGKTGAEVEHADRGDQDRDHADRDPHPAPLDLIVVVLVVDRRVEHQRDGAADEREGQEEATLAEHGAGARVERTTERAREVDADREPGQDPGDRQGDGRGVGGVGLELGPELLAQAREPRLSLRPAGSRAATGGRAGRGTPARRRPTGRRGRHPGTVTPATPTSGPSFVNRVGRAVARGATPALPGMRWNAGSVCCQGAG